MKKDNTNGRLTLSNLDDTMQYGIIKFHMTPFN